MKFRFRFSPVAVCVALLCTLVTTTARADRRHQRITAPAGASAIHLAPTDGRGHHGAELEGLVTSVDTTAPGTISLTDDELGPVDVTLQDTTIIRHGSTTMTLDQIVDGARIHVKASPQDGGGYLAFVIFVQNNGNGSGDDQGEDQCDTEVQGTVTAIDCTAGTMTVTTDSGDVSVTFDTNTIFKSGDTVSTCDQIQLGDAIEVCGTPGDTSVLAGSVKFEAPDDEDSCEDEISGTVNGAPDCAGGTMVVTTESGDVNVTLTDSTEFFGKHHIVATCDDVADGDAVEVEGTLQGDGSITACKVSFEPPEVEDTEVSGTINGAPDGGTLSFVLTTDSGDVTIDTDSNTVIEQDHNLMTFGDLADGMSVEVEGFVQGDGSILATKISIEDSGDDSQD